MAAPLAPIVAVFLLLGSSWSSSAQGFDVVELDALVEAGLERWRIPGLAVAVVAGDSVMTRGYGVRESGRHERVDEHTLFAIGSTTKAFTATALAMLVDEGRLDWDDRVFERIPGFALHDAWVTREITLRDLLAHRSGLPIANEMWMPGHHDDAELLRRLRWLEPEVGFRSRFSYQNVLYMVAGEVVRQVTGKAWSDFVRDRILTPLGMARTVTSIDSLTGFDNVAAPHVLVNGTLRTVLYRDLDAVAPAGALLSSAADLAVWIRFQLTREAGGRRLVSREALAETHRPQIVLRHEGPFARYHPDAHLVTYAMGWFVSDYHGRVLLDHGGGIDGMTALVALVPEEELGVALLMNRQTNTVPPYWVLYPVIDAFLGREPTDRTANFDSLANEVASRRRPTPPKIEASSPRRRLDDYAGTFGHDALGDVRVVVEGGRLLLSLGTLSASLEPWNHDTFRARWNDAAWLDLHGEGWATFRLGRSGEVEELSLSLSPGGSWRLERR